MAFVAANLELVTHGLQKLYMFDSKADALATVVASGYFNDAANELNAGDVIIAKNTGGTLVDMLIVTSARGVTPVTVVNGT